MSNISNQRSMASPPDDTKATNAVTGDSGPGTTLLDILPIPNDTQVVTDPHRKEHSTALEQNASLSHALATDTHEDKGIAQLDHADPEVKDLGWNETKEQVAEPLVGGLGNEELWLLVRRFNKQMYHVKASPYAVPGNLDLNIADEEEFSPDKLRANLERLYTTVIVGLLGFYKHIARLRSWKETRRTSYFCGAYFVAWAFDFVVPLLSTVILSLIIYPPSRAFLFPPAPIALVNSSTGGIQKPRAGVLGSHDSATGAPENHKGEAVEQEASNFVNSIASVALSSTVGTHPPDEAASADQDAEAAIDPKAPGQALPTPAAVAVSAADAKDTAAGAKTHPKHDKTKVPMEQAMWNKMRPVMHGVADVCDTWERFANALSPTSPFPRETSRLRIGTLIVPLLGISLFTSSYMFTKIMTLSIGAGFFGDPLIAPALAWLNRTIPHWQKMLELRNTVLKGVPTNAQLTITLLRIGEANRAPLPPPPRTDAPPPDHAAELTDEHLAGTGADNALDATASEINVAAAPDPNLIPKTTATTTATEAPPAEKGGHHSHASKIPSKIVNLFRGTAAGGVKATLGADSARGHVLRSSHARDRLGVVPPAQTKEGVPGGSIGGPVEFQARWGGKKGTVYLSTAATVPAVAFAADTGGPGVGTKLKKVVTGKKDEIEDSDDAPHAEWSLAVGEIKELRKFGGLGWKAKILVGWSMGREVADGLEIKTSSGETHKITACYLRDELFNRLVAMGGQKWEAW